MEASETMRERGAARFAYEADGVVLINRIKPHTDFHGPFESGLVKMSVIGLGKERQAYEMHCFGVRGLRELVPIAAKRVLATGKIVCGVGIVENAHDETALIEALPANRIFEREPELDRKSTRLNSSHSSVSRMPSSA